MFWWMFLTFVRYSTTSILYLIYLQTAINLYNKLNDPVSNCSIPYTNFKPLIMTYILKRWQDSWDQQIYNKLHEIHSLVGKTP